MQTFNNKKNDVKMKIRTVSMFMFEFESFKFIIIVKIHITAVDDRRRWKMTMSSNEKKNSVPLCQPLICQHKKNYFNQIKRQRRVKNFHFNSIKMISLRGVRWQIHEFSHFQPKVKWNYCVYMKNFHVIYTKSGRQWKIN